MTITKNILYMKAYPSVSQILTQIITQIKPRVEHSFISQLSYYIYKIMSNLIKLIPQRRKIPFNLYKYSALCGYLLLSLSFSSQNYLYLYNWRKVKRFIFQRKFLSTERLCEE